MLEFSLIYPTPDGSREIQISGEKLSFGRGSEADHRFADDGLSRLHATIYRDGDRVWIVDENSSNGTFVNGARAAPAGTPLRNGDSIRIGHRTTLKVRVTEKRDAAASPLLLKKAAAPPVGAFAVGLIAVLVVIAAVSAVVIGLMAAKSDSENIRPDAQQRATREVERKPASPDETVPVAVKSPVNSESSGSSVGIAESYEPPVAEVQSGKKYLEMSDLERRQYVADKAVRIAQIIGNRSGDAIPAAAVDKIKNFTDAYAGRTKNKPLAGCRFGDNLQATFERASKNAPYIVKAFNEKGIDPRIGLYLAMIESEYCVCLQSPSGPLGMFQFARATAELHGLKVFAGASPSNPDERCQPEPSARAAASYIKALTGRYGTGPASVPLAIGSYNSGEGGLSQNLQKALDSQEGLPRDFWTLISNGEKLSKQFQSENFKYVPKFFAAAIIGENPRDFGLDLQPISTYSR